MAGEMATAADGTHPTGMHSSCCVVVAPAGFITGRNEVGPR